MQLKLTDREWGVFNYSELFNSIRRGVRQTEVSRHAGSVPYYSASAINNGLTDLIGNPAFIETSCAIIYTTFGDAYFVEGGFSTSDEITILKSDKLNRYNGKFLANCMRCNKEKYSFGRKAFTGKILRDSIVVPVDSEGKPDYDFMEQYIKELEMQKIQEYREYAESVLEDLEYAELHELSEKEWGSFKIEDLATVISGRDISDADKVKGNIPYISASSIGNGVMEFIGNKNNTADSDIVSISRTGSVGYAFYHEYTGLFSTNVRKIRFKENIGKYASIFMTESIMGQKDKYSYGYIMGTNRIKKQSIVLPVDSEGKPDYNYMEQYVKNLMISKYKKYLEFKS